MTRLAGWRAHQLVFLDDSAGCEGIGRVIRCVIDIHSNYENRRLLLWLGTKKTKPTVIQELKRSQRWSILPAFKIEGYIVYKIHHGSITSEILNPFVRRKVLPFCTSGNGPYLVIEIRS